MPAAGALDPISGHTGSANVRGIVCLLCACSAGSGAARRTGGGRPASSAAVTAAASLCITSCARRASAFARPKDANMAHRSAGQRVAVAGILCIEFSARTCSRNVTALPHSSAKYSLAIVWLSWPFP